jgi:hypothetical protein
MRGCDALDDGLVPRPKCVDIQAGSVRGSCFSVAAPPCLRVAASSRFNADRPPINVRSWTLGSPASRRDTMPCHKSGTELVRFLAAQNAAEAASRVDACRRSSARLSSKR